MELKVRRLGVLSLGKVMGALYGLLGLIFGALFSVFSLIGAGFAGAGGAGEDAVLGLVFGVGAVIILPLVYGFFGFIGGLLTALLFNLVTGIAGGLEMEVDASAAAGWSGAAPPVQPMSPAVR